MKTRVHPLIAAVAIVAVLAAVVVVYHLQGVRDPATATGATLTPAMGDFMVAASPQVSDGSTRDGRPDSVRR